VVIETAFKEISGNSSLEMLLKAKRPAMITRTIKRLTSTGCCMENLAIDIDSIPLTKKAPYGLLPA
jgi:hypothetical protein